MLCGLRCLPNANFLDHPILPNEKASFQLGYTNRSQRLCRSRAFAELRLPQGRAKVQIWRDESLGKVFNDLAAEA
jgi:hypothetical protein